MRKATDAESLHTIEVMIRRRLKAQGKYESVSEAWIKEKALEIHDEAAARGEFIQVLEPKPTEGE